MECITFQHLSRVGVSPTETRERLPFPVPDTVSLGEGWDNVLSSPPIGWLEGDVTTGHSGQ